MSLRIDNASIVDGTGARRRQGTLIIEGERIADVRYSELAAARSETLSEQGPPRTQSRIDASGLVLAPGFIDIHSHGDLILAWPDERREQLLSGRLAQGITSEIIGNCGLGATPLFGNAAPLLQAINGWMAPEAYTWSWKSLDDYYQHLSERGVPVNVGSLAPHGPLRLGAVGLAQAETEAGAREVMRSRLRESLDEGAFGLSAGLIYPPGMYASSDELRELAEVVAPANGLVSFHIRGSSETLLPAVDELIEIGERTGAKVHHSHAEAVGEKHWDKLDQFLDREDAARDRGVRLTADMFPYPVAATMMLAIYPPWSLEGGVSALLARLEDETTRARIREDIETLTPTWPPWRTGGWPHNLVKAVGWDRVIVSTVASENNTGAEGRSLAELGDQRHQHPFDAISDLMIEEGGNVGQFVMDISGEQGLDQLVARDDIAFITDANDYGRGKPHPAAYGSFPRVLARYVRKRGLVSLEQAIRRMTSLPADIIGLKDRGRLEKGAYADIVIFDLERVQDRATLADPRQQAEGIHSVYVNGTCVYTANDGLTGSMPGQVLRRQ